MCIVYRLVRYRKHFDVTVPVFQRCHGDSILGPMKSDDESTVSRESDKFMLRLPDGMRPRIAAVAKANGRSMNAEIVARLESSFSAPPSSTDEAKYQTMRAAARELDFLLSESKNQKLRAKLTIAAKLLSQSSMANTPAAQDLIDRYLETSPEQELIDQVNAQLLKQIDVLKLALQDMGRDTDTVSRDEA